MINIDISLVHIIVGIIILIYGTISLRKMQLYYREGKIINGIVKEVKFNGKAYFPIVEYLDIDNPEKSIISKVDCGSDSFNYKIGTTIELVFYKSKDKTKLFVNSWIYNYGFDITYIILGILCILYGFIKW